jgi:hypothetical protein
MGGRDGGGDASLRWQRRTPASSGRVARWRHRLRSPRSTGSGAMASRCQGERGIGWRWSTSGSRRRRGCDGEWRRGAPAAAFQRERRRRERVARRRVDGELGVLEQVIRRGQRVRADVCRRRMATRPMASAAIGQSTEAGRLRAPRAGRRWAGPGGAAWARPRACERSGLGQGAWSGSGAKAARLALLAGQKGGDGLINKRNCFSF